VEGETHPPPLLQEADLIGLMEKHGIGTDATHSEHIETIKTRNYVGVQNDGSFVPGELGIGLVEGTFITISARNMYIGGCSDTVMSQCTFHRGINLHCFIYNAIKLLLYMIHVLLSNGNYLLYLWV
jgi:hypothetical protein